MARKLGSLLPQVIGIAMLLWALNPENPYGYYVLLRIVMRHFCVLGLQGI